MILIKKLKTIASTLHVELADTDVDAIHRVPTKAKGPKNIIVKFTSRKPRDKLMQAAKKKRLTTLELGLEESKPIYVNEHLCPENKLLLGKAIQTKREKQWKFAWVSEGKILMRKQETSTVVHVTCEEDLALIV